MDHTLRITMVSETEFTVKGHGVHTAYLELTRALQARDDCKVTVNKFRSDADVRHIQTIGLYSLFNLLFGSGKKVVSAHVVPASLVGSIVGAKYWLPLMRAYLKFFYRRADLVFAVSKMVHEVLVQEFGIAEEKVVTFYNVVDMARYETTPTDKAAARQKFGYKDSDFIVVGNGQVQPRKRVDILVDMARTMPDKKFIWVGGITFKALGAAAADMQNMMETAPVNMHITGVIELEAVKDYFQAADVFVLPALQENHPMCVLEAAGAGLPIVLRNIHEYEDTFADAALLADTDDDFARLVNDLATETELRTKMADQSAIIRQRFDSHEGARKAIEQYTRLLNS